MTCWKKSELVSGLLYHTSRTTTLVVKVKMLKDDLEYIVCKMKVSKMKVSKFKVCKLKVRPPNIFHDEPKKRPNLSRTCA